MSALADQETRDTEITDEASPASHRYTEAILYLGGECPKIPHLATAVRTQWEDKYRPRTLIHRGPTVDICIGYLLGYTDGHMLGFECGQDAADADRPSGALGVVFGLVVGVLGTLALFATGYLIGGW